MTVGNMESAELFDAGKKGRGLRATKELNAGEVVFAEASFSAVVFDRYEAPSCGFETRQTGMGTDLFSLSVSLQIWVTHCRCVVDSQASLGCGLISRCPNSHDASSAKAGKVS